MGYSCDFILGGWGRGKGKGEGKVRGGGGVLLGVSVEAERSRGQESRIERSKFVFWIVHGLNWGMKNRPAFRDLMSD